jgi:hypothetical protein
VAAWWAWGVVTSISVVALIVLATLQLRAQKRLAEVARQMQIITATTVDNGHMTQQAESDFVQSIGVAPSTTRVVEELKQASSLAGSTLVSIQSEERSPTIDRLGCLELIVVLRGSYAGNKQVLAHIVDRFPFATISRMRLRRGAGTPEVEMGATLVLWGSAVDGKAIKQ